MSYESRLERVGLWTLQERRHRADLLEVLKMYKGLKTTPFTDFFSFSSTVAITRGHSAKLEKTSLSFGIVTTFLFHESRGSLEQATAT